VPDQNSSPENQLHADPGERVISRGAAMMPDFLSVECGGDHSDHLSDSDTALPHLSICEAPASLRRFGFLCDCQRKMFAFPTRLFHLDRNRRRDAKCLVNPTLK
jgi:hypothetical protein